MKVTRLDEVTFECSRELAEMYKLSPWVWREGGRFGLLLRVVNRSDEPSEKVARIHSGSSADGLMFVVGDAPVIAPDWNDPEADDNGGCEDPTLARVEGTYYVYYSGWNEHRKRGELLLASGPAIDRLEKRGIALPSSERTANPKEATIVCAADGSWRLFFEYAEAGASKIGVARSDKVGGPWEVLPPLFFARPNSWDDWHLSTGPVVRAQSQRPVMFYNGATADARWRIGWVAFDANYERVVGRSAEPLILPHIRRNPDDTDIAFAASAVQSRDEMHLYYSVADQYVVRAAIMD
jgi:predicted GH43/DUF377 family glycosyl hydrolase